MKWPSEDPQFEQRGYPGLAPNEVVYRQYFIARRFWARSRVQAVITNRRFGLSEVSGWFHRKHRWAEVPIQSVRGVDIGYGSIHWAAIAGSILLLLLGLGLGGVGYVLSFLGLGAGSIVGLILFVAGAVALALSAGRTFRFRLFVTSSQPTMAVGFLNSSNVEEFVGQSVGFTFLRGGPGPDILPFLKEAGGILEQIRQSPDQPPRIGMEYQPSGAVAPTPSVDFARFRAELEANKHPDLAEDEVVHRVYHVGRRYLSRANVWAVFTSRRVGIFTEQGWFFRSYRWSEAPKEGLNGVDVGYSSPHYVLTAIFGLWTLLTAWGFFGVLASAPSGVASSTIPVVSLFGVGIEALVLGVLALVGLSLLVASVRRQFIFSLFGPPNTCSAIIASSRWAATRGNIAPRASPGRDVLPFLMHSGAVLQELRQSSEDSPQSGMPTAPAGSSALSSEEARVQRQAIVAQLEQNHHPELGRDEVLYRLYEVGQQFWWGRRVYAMVTNKRAGLLLRNGWLSRSYFWAESDVQSILGVDFSYRYKRLFLVTFRTSSFGYQLTVFSGGLPNATMFACKPGPHAIAFMQQIGGLLQEVGKSPEIPPLTGADYAPTPAGYSPQMEIPPYSGPLPGAVRPDSVGGFMPLGAGVAGARPYQVPTNLVYGANGTPVPPPGGPAAGDGDPAPSAPATPRGPTPPRPPATSG